MLAALAAGKSIRAAAEVAGVSERSAYRRLADATFRAEVARARRELVDRAVGRLASISSEAADALAKLLEADSQAVRRLAAVSILTTLARLRMADELEERIARLEETLLREKRL